MATIIVRENESIESAVRRFKKQVTKEGVLQELRRREFYVAPAEKRRRKSELARKKLKKNVKT